MRDLRRFRQDQAAVVADVLFDQKNRIPDINPELLKGSVRNADGAIAVPVFNGDSQQLAQGILRPVGVLGNEVRGLPGRTAVPLYFEVLGDQPHHHQWAFAVDHFVDSVAFASRELFDDALRGCPNTVIGTMDAGGE
jgi:hypothetical protein